MESLIVGFFFFHPAAHCHGLPLMGDYVQFSGRCLVGTIAFVFKKLPCLSPWLILSRPLLMLLPSTQWVNFSSTPVTKPGYFLQKCYHLYSVWLESREDARPANGIEWLLDTTVLAGKGSQGTWCWHPPLEPSSNLGRARSVARVQVRSSSPQLQQWGPPHLRYLSEWDKAGRGTQIWVISPKLFFGGLGSMESPPLDS